MDSRLCSVVYTDIVLSTAASAEQLIKWRARLSRYLTDAIRDVPESDRLMVDTGDGVFICFFGAPEVAMFAALELQQSFMRDEREQQHGLRVRIGITLGTVNLVKGFNGAENAIGDAISAGQRIQGWAAANQIRV
jgi:class 3 adenylate cyclase